MKFQPIALAICLPIVTICLAADGPDRFDIHFNRQAREPIDLPVSARTLYKVKKILAPAESEIHGDLPLETIEELQLPQGQRQIGREIAVKHFEVLQASKNLAADFQPYAAIRQKGRKTGVRPATNRREHIRPSKQTKRDGSRRLP